MTGIKKDELEVERLGFAQDSRGIVMHNDATNLVIQSATPWTGISSQSAGANKKFFSATSSMGWLKIHYVSGSTYGPTGATGYIPVYRNLNTNIP